MKKNNKLCTDRIAIIGDLHIGVKHASLHHHEYMKRCLDDFFEYLESNNIDTVIQLGDLFDERKFLHLKAWDFFDKELLPKIESLNLNWYQIVGNHDSHYRETLSVNTPALRLSNHKNIRVIETPTEVILHDEKFLLLPWINKENYESCMKAVKNSKSKFVCGHFEFGGFDMYRGSPCRGKFSHAQFSKFERVYSGHFHTFSTKDNVIYTGTPYELTWQDSGDKKCFIVHSQDGYEIVDTKHTLYEKLKYKSGENPPDTLAGKHVRVLLYSRPDQAELNKYIHLIEEQKPYDLKIQEYFAEELSEEKTDIKIKDVKTIISEYIKNSKTELDNDKILQIFDELYNAASIAE